MLKCNCCKVSKSCKTTCKNGCICLFAANKTKNGCSETKQELKQNKCNKNVIYTLRKLKEAGAKIALDDFGTGFSNLTSLTYLPIDFVKIDKSLVWSYAKGDNELLNELMPMIKSEGKLIIAEGIETEEHIRLLDRMCGDFLQGYYYSKPLSEEHFIRYLKEFNNVENI